MLSSIDRMRHSQIWDLLNQYADIREHLEDILSSMQMIQSQMLSDLNDLSVDFDDLAAEIGSCSKSLIRFQTAPDPPVPAYPPEPGQTEELPFPDDDEPFPLIPETDDTRPFLRNCLEEEGR